MSDDKKADDKVDVPTLFGNTIICADTKSRNRDYYEWQEKTRQWKLIPCIENRIADVFVMTRGSAPSSKEMGNALIALGASQRVPGLRSPCVIQFEKKPREATPITDSVFASNCFIRLLPDGTTKTYPYSGSIFSHYRLPYAYDPAATCPEIDAWLADRLGGDPEMIDAFWELAGAALKPGNQWKTFWLFVGEGSTGKTSGLNLLLDILGEENCSALGAPYLNVGPLVVETRGKLLNISEEKTGITSSCEETIKNWSSGGKVNYNPKYRDSSSEPASAKLVFSMNKLPNFSDSSKASYNRPVILNWARPIALSTALPVEEIRRRLRTELPGALNHAIVALQRLEKRGRVIRPAASVELTNALHKESSPVITWFYERAKFRPNARCKVRDAFDDFTNWCVTNRFKLMDRTQFGKQLREVGSLQDGTVVRIRTVRARDGKTEDGKDKYADVYEGLVLQGETNAPVEI